MQRGRFYDADSTPAAAAIVDIYQDEDSFTQELRLSSNSESPLQWIAGLYYFQTHNAQDPKVFYLASSVSRNRDRRRYGIDRSVQQATYSFTDQLSATLGLRYTEDQRDISASQVSSTACRIRGKPPIKISRKISGPIALRSNIARPRTSSPYASYNRGYRAARSTSAPQPTHRWRLKSSTHFEIGIKSDWIEQSTALERRCVQLSVQRHPIAAALRRRRQRTSRLLNAAEARKSAASRPRSLLADPEPRNQRRRNATVNAEYTTSPVARAAPNGGPVTCTATRFRQVRRAAKRRSSAAYDLSGNQMINAPDLTANLSAVYTLPLADTSRLRFRCFVRLS